MEVSAAQIEAALNAFHHGGAHLPLRYANLNGYLHETVIEDTRAYWEAITAEPHFTAEGEAYAVDRLVRDVDVIFSGAAFSSVVFGEAHDRNQEHRADIIAFREAVARYGSATIFGRAGFDALAWLRQTVVERRQRDIEAVAEKLDEKRTFLQPLLLRAEARGRTKYGDYDPDPLLDELSEFMDTYSPPEGLSFFRDPPVFYALKHVRPWLSDDDDPQPIPTDPIAFEHWCAAEIERQGWQVRVSKASGDQGIDVEAMLGELTVAIQCKLYTGPVGNKAVQEAHTGAVHYGARVACVIAVGGFTRAAEELSRSTDVILIDAANIARFTELVAQHLESRSDP